MSPTTNHLVGHQPPTPTPSTTSLRKKSQPDGQQTIPLPSYTSVVARSGRDKTNDLATNSGWKLVQRQRHPKPERSPVNPSMQGRCYRCLAQDHQAQTVPTLPIDRSPTICMPQKHEKSRTPGAVRANT